MISDSHAHITSASIVDQADAILSRAKSAGVTTIINICTDEASLQAAMALQCPFLHHTAATTPHDVATEGESFFPIVKAHAKAGKLVAIGETGLDYHYEHSPRQLQKDYLKRYLELALECSLPVVIHCRDAFEDFFNIIDSHYPNAPGVLHCFTGTLDEAKEVIKRNWYLSLSGIVTFRKSRELQEVAAWVPLNQLLIETDTPYLAPQSHRGKPNEPAYLPETCAFIAALKGVSSEVLAAETAANCKRLFLDNNSSR